MPIKTTQISTKAKRPFQKKSDFTSKLKKFCHLSVKLEDNLTVWIKFPLISKYHEVFPEHPRCWVLRLKFSHRFSRLQHKALVLHRSQPMFAAQRDHQGIPASLTLLD